MAGKKATTLTVGRPVGTKAGAKKGGNKKAVDRERIKKLVEGAINGIETRLGDEKSPPSIGDYLKVMQLQKEIEEEGPKEIRITWVEPETAPTQETEK